MGRPLLPRLNSGILAHHNHSNGQTLLHLQLLYFLPKLSVLLLLHTHSFLHFLYLQRLLLLQQFILPSLFFKQAHFSTLVLEPSDDGFPIT